MTVFCLVVQQMGTGNNSLYLLYPVWFYEAMNTNLVYICKLRASWAQVGLTNQSNTIKRLWAQRENNHRNNGGNFVYTNTRNTT